MKMIKILYEPELTDILDSPKCYKFLKENGKKYSAKYGIGCSACNRTLVDDDYTDIIDKLKKANLILDTYPYLCCECYEEWVLSGQLRILCELL